jgi:hypothetical protein
MKVGRPSKYDPRFIDEVDKYIATTGKEQTELPTKQGFALWIGVDDDTLDNWANAKDKEGNLINPEFFGALKKLMQRQAVQLINDGIYGGKEVNSTIIKLLLQNNHGMKERVDNTTNDKDLPTPILNGLHSNDGNEEVVDTN